MPLFNWLQKRRELERENQSAQDVALQAYLGAMSELIIDHQLRTSQWDEGIQAAARQLGEHASTEDVRTVAWARTSTVLPLLDGERKGRVIQFLYESDLITKDNRVVSLQRCDLKKASLRGLDLSRADLRATSLKEADLRFTNLQQADLRGADLTQTKLRFAGLEQADLREAFLMGADLTYARTTDLTQLPKLANLVSSSEENLETGETKYLESATMPDGKKVEDWLKDREGHGEHGENSGPS